MNTRFQNARAKLFARLSDGAGISGRYIVDGEECEVDAIEGRLSHDGDVFEDMPLIETDSSWLFLRSDIVVSGRPVTPNSGHYWIANGRRYKVLPPVQGAKCYEPLGNDSQLIRVHTKDVGAEDA